MRQFHEHFIAMYPLLTGGNRLVEVFGTVKWEFGPFETFDRCDEVAATIFPRLRLFRLPMQSGELDIDALRILVNALVMRDVSRTA